MDSFTHIALGAVISPALYGGKLGRAGWITGALGATLPDFDMFIRTGDSVLDHVLHRSFTHSLLLAPVLGVIAALPFAVTRKWHAHWRELMVVGILGVISHILLDACTAYGTQMLWPFSAERYAADILPIVDFAFTLPLIAGLIWSLRRGSMRIARATLGFIAAYTALAAVQHERAMGVQRALIAARGDFASRGRVLPSIGTICGFRSIYESGGIIVCDAIRVPFYAPGVAREGESITQFRATDLKVEAGSQAARSIASFIHFADGYAARMEGAPHEICDMRYSARAGVFLPLWGIRIEGSRATWISLTEQSDRTLNGLWRDMIGTGPWKNISEFGRL